MAHVIVRGKAHRQNIGVIVKALILLTIPAQFLPDDRLLGKFLQQVIRKRRIDKRLIVRFFIFLVVGADDLVREGICIRGRIGPGNFPNGVVIAQVL